MTTAQSLTIGGLLLATTSVLAVTPALATDYVPLLTHKDWQVDYMPPGGDLGGACVASTASAGASLILMGYNDGSVELAFSDVCWNLTPDQDVSVIVNVDYAEWPAGALSDTNMISFVLGTGDQSATKDFLASLAEGNALALKNADGTRLSTFSLRGSKAAILKLIECKDRYFGVGVDRTDPFGTEIDQTDPFGTVVTPVAGPAAAPAPGAASIVPAHGPWLPGKALMVPAPAEDPVPTADPAEAQVTWKPDPDDFDRAIITIKGEFTDTTTARFDRVVDAIKAGYPGAIDVHLASPGGDALAGIEIDELIRKEGFATVVPDGAICASACAVAWLGGVQLNAGDGALVGFHQAYNGETGIADPQGNALVGAYLGRLGYGYETTLMATMAKPEEVHWLTPEAAAEAGLTVKFRETV